MTSTVFADPYVLATGAAAVRRLHALHNVYSPAGKRVLLQAGLGKGMKVVDFGCGVGVVTRMLAELVGPSGHVIGVDVAAAQLQEARKLCEQEGLNNVSFLEASASSTGLPRNSFDLVYCRFLLLHLPDPAACLREMKDVLKPDGILVVEDGDLASAGSFPPTASDMFADLFEKLGAIRGLDYRIGRRLFHLVMAAGFTDLNMEIHQPAITKSGQDRLFLKWSVEEAGPALVNAGLTTQEDLGRTLSAMHDATEDPSVVILAPRMSQIWAKKSGPATGKVG